MVAGRDFLAEDRDGTAPVAIVSESAARQFWPGQSAVGKYLVQPTWGRQGPTTPMRTLLVVGVARDLESSSVIDGLARTLVYVPFQQQYWSSMTIVARTTRGKRTADELRALLASMNQNLPIVTTQTLRESVALGLAPQRVVAGIAGTLRNCRIAAHGNRDLRRDGLRRHAPNSRDRNPPRTRCATRRHHQDDPPGSTIPDDDRVGNRRVLAAAVARVVAGFLFGIPPAIRRRSPQPSCCS